MELRQTFTMDVERGIPLAHMNEGSGVGPGMARRLDRAATE